MGLLGGRVEVVDHDRGLLVSLADCLVFDVVYRYHVVLGGHYRRYYVFPYREFWLLGLREVAIAEFLNHLRFWRIYKGSFL